MLEPFPQGKFGAILADPPWRFETWNNETAVRCRTNTPKRHGTYASAAMYYQSLSIDEICAFPIAELAADDCCLFLWITWPNLEGALKVINQWGFKYKTCGFAWIKARASQLEMFKDQIDVTRKGLGYWTRANSEVCLLATKGKPKRLNADVWQAIIEPRREHSRKPDCVHDRIERLVAGPYLELFARARRRGWEAWGNELDKFTQYDATEDFARSIDECYREIRERKANGGKDWTPP